MSDIITIVQLSDGIVFATDAWIIHGTEDERVKSIEDAEAFFVKEMKEHGYVEDDDDTQILDENDDPVFKSTDDHVEDGNWDNGAGYEIVLHWGTLHT